MAKGSLDENIIVNKLCINEISLALFRLEPKKRNSFKFLSVIRLE